MLGLLCVAGPVQAASRRYDVWLEDAAGGRIHLAELAVAADGREGLDGLDTGQAPFTDHFLSMRLFKCIEGPEKQ